MTNKVDVLYALLNKQPVLTIGRASNMLWVGFGKVIEYTDIKGEHCRKSSVALHVQSTWRMIDKEENKILFAGTDVYSPNSILKSSNDFKWDDFNWEIQQANLFDEKSTKWIKNNNSIYIEECNVNKMGDLTIQLSNNNILEVIVDVTDDTECWRVFEVGKKNKHIVMTGEGWL